MSNRDWLALAIVLIGGLSFWVCVFVFGGLTAGSIAVLAGVIMIGLIWYLAVKYTVRR